MNFQSFFDELGQILEKRAAAETAAKALLTKLPAKYTIPAIAAGGVVTYEQLKKQLENWKMGRQMREQMEQKG